MSSMLRTTLWGVSALAMMAVAGCDRSELQDFAPPPSAYVEAPTAPPSAAPQGRVETTELLGGPAPAAPRVMGPEPDFGGMAPIANPEDMTRAERLRVYGPPRAATPRAESRNVRRVRQPDRAAVARSERPVIAQPAGPVTRPVISAPKPAAPQVTARPAPVPAKPAVPPVVAAKPVAPAAPAVPKPAAPVVAKAPEPAKPVKPQTKAEQLGAAVAADVTSGSKLNIPAALAAGQPEVVVLTLPEGLLGRIQDEATKLGLTVPARTVDTRATLTGEGYKIVPSASQAARLKTGEATSFAWQVEPGPGVKGPLKATVGGELKGGAKPVAFPITTIEQAVVAPAAAAAPAKKGFDWKGIFGGKKAADVASNAGEAVADGATAAGDAMADGAAIASVKGRSFIDRVSIPGHPTVTLPAFGEVRSGNVVLIGLGILALIILSALGRAAGERRRSAERRRKFRTMADFNSESDVDNADNRPAPTTVHEHHEPAVVHHHEPVATDDQKAEKKEPEHV